ncbi:hypothetical protein Ciccas_000853 [Cichlidogyrus casuarinus]|uniref:SAM domain-containing protein n=1 Tax=Cichlidogyrus casuarinus TaxID=1844966 RepID=A0ABD2QLQ7_9PLAT
MLPNGTINTAVNTTVEQWLHWLGMDQYANNFVRFGVPTLAIAQQLRPEDLVQMGISRPTDRQMLWHHLQVSKQALDPRVYAKLNPTVSNPDAYLL